MMDLSRPVAMPGVSLWRRAWPGASSAAWFHVRTTAFRWFLAYTVIFLSTLGALSAVIQYSVMAAMQREADSGLRWQLRYFDAYPDADLPQAIQTRMSRQAHWVNEYGLFAPGGQHLAGAIRDVPRGLPFDTFGQSHNQVSGVSLPIDIGRGMVRVRALGERRADGASLVVARTLDDEGRMRDELMRTLAIGGLVCLGGGLCAGLLFGMGQMRRVAEIRRVTACIASGDLARRLPVSSHDELGMLCGLVNQMLEEIEGLMAEVKGACDIVAHDLRTPLIHLRSRLSALSKAMGSPAEPALALADVDAILDRFAALLRISEIGSLQRRSAFAQMTLGGLVSELCDLYMPLAEERGIVFVTRQEPAAPIWGDRELLFEALSNLVDNAIKFTPSGGRVEVMLLAGEAGPQLVVSDTGPGIPESERRLVFTRFYRSERTRHIPGTGLGLGLVAAVVRLHNFTLHLGDAGNAGTGAVVTIDCSPGGS